MSFQKEYVTWDERVCCAMRGGCGGCVERRVMKRGCVKGCVMRQ